MDILSPHVSKVGTALHHNENTWPMNFPDLKPVATLKSEYFSNGSEEHCR
jgi:hypothetical protein